MQALLNEVTEGVYSFGFLTDEFCGMLLGELDCYAASGLPAARCGVYLLYTSSALLVVAVTAPRRQPAQKV